MSYRDNQHQQTLAIDTAPETLDDAFELYAEWPTHESHTHFGALDTDPSLDQDDKHLPIKLVSGALVASTLLTAAITVTDAQAAHAAEVPTPPAVKIVPVKSGGSAWSTMAENTHMTPAQIAAAIPAFEALNGPVVHPNELVKLPEVADEVHVIKYHEIVWNLIEQHYGKVTPQMVAKVAAANNRPNFDEYYAGQRIILPASLANTQPTPVAAPAERVPETAPNQAPVPQKIEMPAITPNTAIWHAKPGAEVLVIIDVVSKLEKVPPATVAGWIRDANQNVDLAKLTDGQELMIPGVSAEQWDNLWKNVNKLALFSAWVQAAAKNAEAPVSPNVLVPSNVVKLQKNYVRMPDAPNGEYRFANANPNVHAGSEALIQTAYTVGIKWKALHPESPLVFEDFNAADGHASHDKGIDVDVITADNSAATIHGSRERNIELAKMFFDTGQVEVIFFNDPVVRQTVMEYAKEHGLPGRMEYWPDHDTHFHVRVKLSYALEHYDNAPPELPPPPPAPAPAPVPTPATTPEAPADSFALTPEQSAKIDSFNLRTDQKDFLKTIIPIARKMQAEYHTNAAVDVAQAIYESDWGTQHEGNNYHGMMADGLWHGPTHTRTDWVPDGKGGRIYHQYQFKTYNSLEESFIDHAKLIARAPQYQDSLAAWQDWQAYLEGLQHGGPAYAAVGEPYITELSGVINDFHLDELAK